MHSLLSVTNLDDKVLMQVRHKAFTLMYGLNLHPIFVVAIETILRFQRGRVNIAQCSSAPESKTPLGNHFLVTIGNF